MNTKMQFNSSSAHTVQRCSTHTTHSYYYQINFSYSVTSVSYKLLRLDSKFPSAYLSVFMMNTSKMINCPTMSTQTPSFFLHHPSVQTRIPLLGNWSSVSLFVMLVYGIFILMLHLPMSFCTLTFLSLIRLNIAAYISIILE
jgi:hypothetical protein